jgi:uncharacterized membrane protein YkvI
MFVFDICQWLQDTRFATSMRESIVFWPVLEGTHLIGMSLMMAPVMMYDFRLIGVRWKKDPVSKVKWGFLPITFFGFVLMVVTGTLLFISEPVKCYKSVYFRIKVAALILAGLNALVFHSTIDRTTAQWDNASPTPIRARMAGFLSLALWTVVIFAGRYTAYNL